MAKLADALDLGSSGLTVQVRILLAAPARICVHTITSSFQFIKTGTLALALVLLQQQVLDGRCDYIAAWRNDTAPAAGAGDGSYVIAISALTIII